MKQGRIACFAIAAAAAAAAAPAAAGKDKIEAALEAAIAEYQACNRTAVEAVENRVGRSLGWRAAYAEGTCLHTLEPVNELMLELHVAEVTFYKLQGLRTQMLRQNVEQIQASEMP